MVGNYQTLTDFQKEIMRIESAKNDFIVPARKLWMLDDERITFDSKSFGMNQIAHEQIASKLGIPMAYYKKMDAIHGLRSENINSWLGNSRASYMVRTIDDRARAFLSDAFKPIDNALILSAFAPVVSAFPDVVIKSQSLTDERMYLQAIFPVREAEIVKGDVVQAGVTLTNSEVGRGSVDVSTTVWRLVCSNGMIGESILNRKHVGRRIGDDEGDYNLFQRDTIQAELKAFQLKLRDCLMNALSEASWNAQIEKMQAAAGIIIERPETATKNVTKRFSDIFGEDDSERILSSMVLERDFSQWGLVNGITAIAKTEKNIDRQFKIEQLGSEVLAMTPKEVKMLEEVA